MIPAPEQNETPPFPAAVFSLVNVLTFFDHKRLLINLAVTNRNPLRNNSNCFVDYHTCGCNMMHKINKFI